MDPVTADAHPSVSAPAGLRSGRGIAIAALVALTLVTLADVAVRAAVPHMRPFNSWSDWEATNKVERMDALARRGGASIVLAGSSMMNAAGDPVALGKTLDVRRPVFNASLNGAGSQLMDFWLLHVVVPRLHPRIVVLGVSSRDLNDRGISSGDAYRSLRRSTGGRSVAPNLSPTERIEAIAEKVSAVVRYRSILRQPSRWFGTDPRQVAAVVSPLGVPRAIRFLNHPYKIKDDFYPRIVPRMYSNFSTGGVATRSLDHLVSSLVALKIQVVLVEMPITLDVYPVHPNGMDDYRLFERSLGAVVSESGARFINMIPRFPSTLQFGDPLHVNGEGRQRFTDLLAAMLRAGSA
jgi:hypothetical protein